MLEFITKFFRREEASRTLAKERLRLVLMSDRVSLAPEIFDEMKGEMLAVIRRYLEIDEHALDMHFESLERQFALLASIPVLKVKTRQQAEVRAHAIDISPAPAATAATNGTPAHKGRAATNGAAGSPEPRAPRRRRRRRRTATPPPQDGAAPPDAGPPTP